MTPSPSDDQRTGPLDERMAQGLLATAMLLAAGSGLSYGFVPDAAPAAMRAPLAALWGGMAVLFGVVAACLPRLPIRTAVVGVSAVAALMIGLSAAAKGSGVHSLSLAWWPFLVILVGVFHGVRAAGQLAAACVAMTAALAWVDVTAPRWWPAPVSSAHDASIGADVISLTAMLMAATTGGTLISRLLRSSVTRASERERRFRELLHMSVDWYWELDEQLRYSDVKNNLDPASGIRIPAEIGRTPWELSDSGLTPDELDAHRADLESRLPFRGLLARRRGPDGRSRYVSISGEPKFDRQGRFRGYWGVGHDITAEVHAERAQRASEGRYRELFDRAPTAIVLHRKGIILDANPAAASLFGFASVTPMQGYELSQLYVAGLSRARALLRIRHLERQPMGDGLPVADFDMRAIDGRHLWAQATGVRVLAEGGPASMSIYHDVTARKTAEEALTRSESLLTHLFETSPGCVTLSELNTGRYVMVNPGFTEIFGYEPEEVIGRSATELGIWHRAADRDQIAEQARRSGGVRRTVCRFRTRDGSIVSLQFSGARFEMDGKTYMVSVAFDVTDTERTRLEHGAILQNALIGIGMTRAAVFVQANPRFEQMLGWPVGSLTGQPSHSIWPTQEEFIAAGRLFAPRLASGESVELERELARRDGSRLWCRLLVRAVNAEDPSHGGTIWIAEDITERRRTEHALEAARDAAEAASRAKSAFLANTSHEIRTPLNGLLGLAQLALREGLDESVRLRFLRQILESAEGLSGIISDILDLSKIEAGKFTFEAVPFDLRTMLANLRHAYESLADSRGLRFSLQIDAAIPQTVRGDPLRTRQILGNYISNALKFTQRGAVSLTVRLDAQGRVHFAVTDTGPGIDEATLARLFKPFTQADESTTRRFGGTGLGLSICSELAHLMGGEVGAHSTLGEGSTFWTALPLPQAELDFPITEQGGLDEPLLGARVLMVEDNPVNMMVAVAMLEQWGVRVTQVADGQAALEAVAHAEEALQPFDAVLMDVQMPVMSGHEAARRLRQRPTSASLPIIALTAAALVSEREEALAAGMNDFLTKPIDPPRLRRVLTHWVAQGSNA